MRASGTKCYAPLRDVVWNIDDLCWVPILIIMHHHMT